MVITNKRDCVNEELSLFGKFKENDPVRPDLAGHYSWFSKLIMEPTKTNHSDIFRINKGENYIIVSENIKQTFENIQASGAKFIEV
jgi:hypothetical protein